MVILYHVFLCHSANVPEVKLQEMTIDYTQEMGTLLIHLTTVRIRSSKHSQTDYIEALNLFTHRHNFVAGILLYVFVRKTMQALFVGNECTQDDWATVIVPDFE